jgi:hypothetical protein
MIYIYPTKPQLLMLSNNNHIIRKLIISYIFPMTCEIGSITKCYEIKLQHPQKYWGKNIKCTFLFSHQQACMLLMTIQITDHCVSTTIICLGFKMITKKLTRSHTRFKQFWSQTTVKETHHFNKIREI